MIAEYFDVIRISDGFEKFAKRVDYKNEGENVWRPIDYYLEHKKEIDEENLNNKHSKRHR